VRAIRLALRFFITVLALSAVIFILVGGFWYVWQNARGRAPQVGYTITSQKIERAALGLYLRYRGEEVSRPAAYDDARAVTFVVNPGDPVSTIALRLQRQGLVTDAELFRRVVQYWGADSYIQAGVYTLRPNMTMEEIMGELQHGRLPSITVTVPEGWRAEEIAALLEEKGVTSADGFLQAVRQGRNDLPFLQDRPEGSPASLEGFLFPDTYQFPEAAEPSLVVDIMLQNWNLRLPETVWRQAAEEQGLTLYEVVTLASIVEREAVVATERPTIAGVFLKRLDEGMWLQSDPTVQYAKGYDPATAKWWNPTTEEDWTGVVSPYNTYQQGGLPPGPICNPGLSAIKAVLQPEDTDYRYFYSKGDGSHVFAVTYEEHLANIARLSGGQ